MKSLIPIFITMLLIIYIIVIKTTQAPKKVDDFMLFVKSCKTGSVMRIRYEPGILFKNLSAECKYTVIQKETKNGN